MGRPKGSLNVKTLQRIEASKNVIAPNPVNKVDSWSNFFAGLGSAGRDKSIHTAHDSFTALDEDTLAGIYMADGLAARVINTVADDMTREWIDIEGASEKLMDDIFLELGAEEKFNEAIRWQRLFGGSLIIVGAMDGRPPNLPLVPEKIKTIEYLKVVARTDIPISECTFDKNPMSPTFGKIIVYKINMYVHDTWVPMFVHHTRCIPFYNDPIPPRIRSMVTTDERYWGMSSLQTIYESLRNLGGINQSIINILYEFIIGKYKIKDLNEMLAQGQEGLLIKRIEVMNMSKSVINGVLLGEDEEYTRDYATLAGLPEVIDRFMLALSGSTGIPVTRLFGRSPAGLNATGENDLRNYYDLVEAAQRNKLRQPLRRLVTLIASWQKVPVPEFDFNSLYQLDEQEKANVEKTYAEVAKLEADTQNIYATMGAKGADEVRKEKGWASEDISEEEDE